MKSEASSMPACSGSLSQGCSVAYFVSFLASVLRLYHITTQPKQYFFSQGLLNSLDIPAPIFLETAISELYLNLYPCLYIYTYAYIYGLLNSLASSSAPRYQPPMAATESPGLLHPFAASTASRPRLTASFAGLLVEERPS